MLIVNDLGNEVVNSELVFAFSIIDTPEGANALLCQGVAQWRAAVCVGSRDRCERALAEIVKGVKERRHYLDLRDLLGQRPGLSVAQPRIIMPGNGQGMPGSGEPS